MSGADAKKLRRWRKFLLLGLPLLAVGSAGRAAPLPPAAVYEMRIYDAAPGKFERLNARFRDHTLRLFAKHGMTSVGYWSEEGVADGRLVYILAYPSREQREAAWTAFRADPEWQAAAKASEAEGKLVAKVTSVFLKMTDYSPALQVAP